MSNNTQTNAVRAFYGDPQHETPTATTDPQRLRVVDALRASERAIHRYARDAGVRRADSGRSIDARVV